MTTRATPPLTKDIQGLAGIFAVSGVVHLVKPEVYEPLMPKIVPAHREVIVASGVLELVCAAGLLHPRTRVVAGWASAALLLAVYPANLKMASDLRSSRKTGLRTAAFARLPLQVPMIRSAVRAARG
ncbi:DoxX family protein [Nocardioides allogilvus]|uniref:DoxX family protein n=1 Tax=Nocardioides allogilvus TaxID=2072017 RepID=UPI000D30064A|nr:DoxX family protein [Nocardioides allogilvus]